MPTATPYLGLALYNSTTDQAVTFASFRAAWGGTPTTSNFYKIDISASGFNDRITALEALPDITVVPALYVSANYYEANSISAFTAYRTNDLISIYLDTTSSGSVTLNINALGTKSLYKVNSSGSLVNLSGSDLQKGRRYLFQYNGSAWQWVGATSGDQITINGTAGNFVVIGSDKTLSDGGTLGAIIDALTAKTTLASADEIGLADSADSYVGKKITWSNFQTAIGTVLGVIVDALTGKTTPVDADEIVIADSDASFASKKVTFTNMKAFYKTYFDTLYATVTASVVNQAVQRLLSSVSAITTTEGYFQWDSTRKLINIYDSQRERGITAIGWTPYAYPDGVPSVTAAFATSNTLAAAGGTALIPIRLTAPMLLKGVSVLNNNTGTARTWGWDLYEQYLNNGNSGENTITRIATGSANETFTPSAASVRTIDATSSVFLASGVYWLAVQCRHASNTFLLGTSSAGALSANTFKTKTTTNPNGSTLDAVAATWTASQDAVGARLNGVVFGQTSAY